MILGHLRVSDNTFPICFFRRKSDLGVPSYTHTLLCGCCHTEGGKRCSRLGQHFCLYVKGHDVARNQHQVWLTHGFEGGVFVESHCAVVAVRVWKPLSKWPIGWVIQVVLFWCERTIVSVGYTRMNDATRQWRCGCQMTSSNYNTASNSESWSKSPQGPCGPAVPTITGLQWPHGTCGSWIGDRRQPRWGTLVPHCW